LLDEYRQTASQWQDPNQNLAWLALLLHGKSDQKQTGDLQVQYQALSRALQCEFL
jgi:hypothetical protein